MSKSNNYLTIGETARRSGVATSALRFYETRGLVRSDRGQGNHRRYHRSMLRRISLIKIAQSLGLSLREISGALDTLPDKRTPTQKDWQRLSTQWGNQLDHRIKSLQQMREQLTGCIGCGCLSLQRCPLYNPNDEAGTHGVGPRYLLGDVPEEVTSYKSALKPGE
jgi:MerR family redox-sensitive transcriptional activator SoxR